MSFIICSILLILCIALAILSLFLIYKKEELEDELAHAEQRAVAHFRRLNEIETIIKKSNQNKEHYFTTLNKIERVIFANTTFER